MFKKFRELFSSENLLDTAYNTTVKMLEFDHKMFMAASETLRLKDNAELPFDIRKTDRKINKYQREVRRNVLTHLTIAGTQNIVPGLMLVSIVIDVERIGDYTKNISELATSHPERLKAGYWEKDLCAIEEKIRDHFPKVIEVLSRQDKQLGRSIMQQERETSRMSDQMVTEIIAGGSKNRSLSTSDAVVLALYARFLKRTNSHLNNIATAVVNPFPRIGYREKKESK
ncbi:MAG: PhoU domain-containing protein [bacterium]